MIEADLLESLCAVIGPRDAARFVGNVTFGPGCWPFGSVNVHGYSQFLCDRRRLLGHRLAVLADGREIPEGMEVDHLCHGWESSCKGGPTCLHRRCVRPDHLEVVTPLVNQARATKAQQTHCKHGHAFDEANTSYRKRTDARPHGGRVCRRCKMLAARRRKASR